MSKRKWFFSELPRTVIPVAILAVGVGGLVVISGGKKPDKSADVAEAVPLVETARVEAHEEGLVIETDGLVVPFREINLAAEVAGRINEKSPQCEAGTYVEAGELLMEIDPRTYELDVQRLEREVDQAEANLQELKVEASNTESLIELAAEDLELQRRELERMRKLWDRKATSEASLDEAKRAEVTARNSLTSLENQLRMTGARRNRLRQAKALAEARLELAGVDLSRTQVHAPVDGVVVRAHVEEGGYVQPGTELVALEDTSAVEVTCSLQVDELGWLWEHAGVESRGEHPDARRDYQLPRVAVTVIYDVRGRRYAWDGVLDRYDGLGLNEKTRTVPCRIVVSEPRKTRALAEDSRRRGPRALVRGMYVTVQLHLGSRTPLLKVPERAVRPGNQAWRVRDGRLHIVDLDVAQATDELVLVRADSGDWVAGDRVVITPLSAVHDGMSVRLAKTNELATDDFPTAELPETDLAREESVTP
ncbi:MAG: efflux RND transporter periplasmic adaptor subunit [Planctomycetota bacterium]